MNPLIYEPSHLEIRLTLALGLTILSPYYCSFAQGLELTGNEQVMDFGSGSGVCTRHIAAQLGNGGHLTCVDVSTRWMNVITKTLRKYDNVSYLLGQISELNLPEAEYDVVILHYVLHDIPAWQRAEAITFLAGTLKPGGRMILREPIGHGLTYEEIHLLGSAAHFLTQNIQNQNLIIGAAYNACFSERKIQ